MRREICEHGELVENHCPLCEKPKRGGPGRGQGRKTLAESGELMKARPVRMTDEQWQKCKDLGGAAWVRRMIDKAKTPNAELCGWPSGPSERAPG